MKNRPFDYVTPVYFKSHPDFKNPKRVKQILKPMPGKAEFNKERELIRAQQKQIPPSLRATYLEPLLNKDQEIHLFKKYNYLKYQASQIQKEFSRDFSRQQKRRFRDLLRRAKVIQDQIAACNYRLAPSIVSKRSPGEHSLNDAYLRIWLTVPKFDIKFGWKFSTYATYAINNGLTQNFHQERKIKERYLTGMDIKPDKIQKDDFVNEVLMTEEEKRFKIVADAANLILEEMDKNPAETRRAFAVRQYFGLTGEGSPKILTKIGEEMSITKERVRQLKQEGLDILKERLVAAGVADIYEKLDIC